MLGCRISGTRRLAQSEGAEQRALRIQILSGQRDADETRSAIGMGEVLRTIGRRLVEPCKENVAERAFERKVRVPAVGGRRQTRLLHSLDSQRRRLDIE